MNKARKKALQHDTCSAADFHKVLALMIEGIDLSTRELRTSIRRIRKLQEEHFAADKPVVAPRYDATERLKIEIHFFNRVLQLVISDLSQYRGFGTLARHVLGESELKGFLSSHRL
jgi:hypothetical protein